MRYSLPSWTADEKLTRSFDGAVLSLICNTTSRLVRAFLAEASRIRSLPSARGLIDATGGTPVPLGFLPPAAGCEGLDQLRSAPSLMRAKKDHSLTSCIEWPAGKRYSVRP